MGIVTDTGTTPPARATSTTGAAHTVGEDLPEPASRGIVGVPAIRREVPLLHDLAGGLAHLG